MQVRSFPPLIDEGCRVLVLGSMPGAASLKAARYYWNPRNYMWRILYALFAHREPDETYEERVSFAMRQRVALWDVIDSCDRKGSLDSDIREAVPNDIPGLLRQYPGIRAVVSNGSKSFAELNKHFGGDPELAGRTIVKLPSTSPIPTPQYRNLDDRLEAWRLLRELVSD